MTDVLTEQSIVELDIVDVAYGGKGVARLDGCVFFVPGALQGERIRAKVTRRRKRFVEADLVEILTPAAERQEPECPLSETCPGCVYQHVAYHAEVAIKQAQLKSLLQRLGHVDGSCVAAPVPAPRALGYRNKITLHADLSQGEPMLGYVGKDNKTVFSVPQCPLAVAEINRKLASLMSSDGFKGSLTDEMLVTLRHTPEDGVLFWKGRKARSERRIFENTALGKLRLPRDSFFQVYPAVANALTEAVMAHLTEIKPGYAIDLYCGVGVFALAAAKCGVPSVLGVDSDDHAVRAAHRNAVKLELEGLEFITAPVDRVIKEALDAVPAAETTVIIDPPRRGLSRDTLETLCKTAPAHILYISCAADTLSRDIAHLTESGYQLKTARLYDMFPRTAIFETLTWLTKTQ